MTNYVCASGHSFNQPTKIIKKEFEPIPDGQMQTLITELLPTSETFVCPICKTLSYSEAPDRQPLEVCVTGDWAQVNKLLAEGWVIKSTYAKEYHLFRFKEAKQ